MKLLEEEFRSQNPEFRREPGDRSQEEFRRQYSGQIGAGVRLWRKRGRGQVAEKKRQRSGCGEKEAEVRLRRKGAEVRLWRNLLKNLCASVP
jgi:hypothetical protein